MTDTPEVESTWGNSAASPAVLREPQSGILCEAHTLTDTKSMRALSCCYLAGCCAVSIDRGAPVRIEWKTGVSASIEILQYFLRLLHAGSELGYMKEGGGGGGEGHIKADGVKENRCFFLIFEVAC
jgi:hypothetical protein